jgi:hypothetical protein
VLAVSHWLGALVLVLAVVWCVEESSYAECAAWWGCDDRKVVTLPHSVKELVEKGVAKNVVPPRREKPGAGATLKLLVLD